MFPKRKYNRAHISSWQCSIQKSTIGSSIHTRLMPHLAGLTMGDEWQGVVFFHFLFRKSSLVYISNSPITTASANREEHDQGRYGNIWLIELTCCRGHSYSFIEQYIPRSRSSIMSGQICLISFQSWSGHIYPAQQDGP